MVAAELKEMYLEFFRLKGHSVISGGSLIPENDPTILFTTAGMHPLVPYLLGKSHPEGKRLCNYQKCIRTGDIEEVGDATHLTFFEMLGNWSLGDYFKDEAIAWSYEFLTSPSYLGFDPNLIYVTVFEGNETVGRDDQSLAVWKKLGIPETRIFALPIEDNWWGPAGATGPCGPDTEMFIDTGKAVCGINCRPGCSCGKFFEIWNDVFMQYQKTETGTFVPLENNNVDTGMGVERTIAMMQKRSSVFETELFAPLISLLTQNSGKKFDQDQETGTAFRIIADHLRSSAFIIGDEQGIVPSNLGQGYVLRRLLRRSVRYAKKLGLKTGFTVPIMECIIQNYKAAYPELETNGNRIIKEAKDEEEKFEITLNRGMEELDKILSKLKGHNQTTVSGRVAFKLYDTFGFPLEFTEEICNEQGITINRGEFDAAFEKHRDVSKKGSEKAFKGGLADSSDSTTQLHTATHLLHKSLQLVIGEHANQKGSNITADRLRFDFTHPEKLSAQQLQQVEDKQVEDMVNKVITDKLPITMETMTIEEARKSGAMALFSAKYGQQINVYSTIFTILVPLSSATPYARGFSTSFRIIRAPRFCLLKSDTAFLTLYSMILSPSITIHLSLPAKSSARPSASAIPPAFS